MKIEKLFCIKADAEFYAKDIDNAFYKLEQHFKKLRKGEDESLIVGGEMYISICEEKK